LPTSCPSSRLPCTSSLLDEVPLKLGQGAEGPFGNVVKIRPPLVFGREHADILIEALDRSLAAL
jgi:hypothetical protein